MDFSDEQQKTIGVVVRRMLHDPFQSTLPLHEVGENMEGSYFVCYDAPKDTRAEELFEESCFYWGLAPENCILTD